jgi:SAM-dependent methyltransferase
MPTLDQRPPVTAEAAIYARYARAAGQVESALCCPVEYDRRLLAVIPPEIIERDYGCGDPTPFVRPGDVVLDLGAGGGKVCYMAAQLAGPAGRVIGIDCNAEMLALARGHQTTVAQRLGYANVEFRCGLIQDLRLDLDALGAELARRSVCDTADWLELRQLEDRLRHDRPLVANESIDCVLSNCVLNLVRPQDRRELFAEVFRVLRRGGRAAISDIVADEDVPARLRDDPQLWSGCIAGAWREDEFLKAFEVAGFHGIQLVKRQAEPWRVVEGIEFRSITVLAHKGKQGPCLERNQAVIYRGPFRQVEDDDGHTYRRGERAAVCDKTFKLLGRDPYAGMFELLEPSHKIPLEDAASFDCSRPTVRHPREMKGAAMRLAVLPADTYCDPDGSCC